MAELPEVGVSVVADTRQYDKQMKQVIADANKVDKLDPTVSVMADTSDVQKLEKSIKGISGKSVDIDVNASGLNTIKGDLDELKTTTFSPDIKPVLDDAAIKQIKSLEGASFAPNIKPTLDKTAKKAVESLGDMVFAPKVKPEVSGLEGVKAKIEGVKAKITATTDATISGAETILAKIKAPKVKIDATTELASGKLDAFLQTVQSAEAFVNLTALLPENLGELPLIGFAFQLNTAVTQFDAATSDLGDEVDDIGGIITRAITGQWADSALEAAGYAKSVLEITQNAEDLESNMTKVFEAATGTGEDFETVLRAMNTLVAGGFASDFQDAADIITVGFQGGLNTSDDFLDTLIEYSKIFKGMGLSAAQVLTVLSQGFAEGVFTGDKIADVFKEADIRIKDVVDETSAVSEALNKLDFRDEALGFVTGEDGALAGDEFWAEFADRINAGLASGDLDFIDAVELLGTPFEDITQGVFEQLGLDIGSILPQFTEEGRAGASGTKATEFFSDAQTALDTLLDTINVELSTTLAEALDLDGFITRLTEGIGEFSSLVSEGETLAVAIEQAFKIEGFAATVSRLEVGLANFLIGLLDFVASVQSILPGQQEAAAATRAEVARLQAGQLEFDVGAAPDLETLQFAVNTAINRGVSGSDVIDILTDKFNAAVEGGDLGLATQLENMLQSLTIGQATGDDPLTGLAARDFIDTSELGAALTEARNTAFELLNEGDFAGALDIAKAIDDDLLIEDIKSILETDFALALERGQFLEAAGLGDQLFELFDIDTTELQSDLLAVRTDTDDTAQGFTEAGDKAKAGMQTAQSGTTISSHLIALALSEIIRLQDAIIARSNLLGTEGIIGAANQGAVPPPRTQRSGDTNIPGEASGGVFQGSARIHPGEIMMTGPRAQDVAVLNAQTSSTVLSGLGQLLGGMGLGTGPTTNNSRGDTNITINSASAAEDVQALNATTNAMRGF